MCRLGPKYSETVSNVTALSEILWPSNELGGNELGECLELYRTNPWGYDLIKFKLQMKYLVTKINWFHIFFYVHVHS